MRLMDIMLAIPGFLMAIGIVALWGEGGLVQVMIAIGVVNIPIFTRLMRGSIIAQRDNDYVLAARSVGVPGRKILASHIIPNAISPVIVAATLALATAIIDAAGLGFLGLGPQDPATPEWGTMLTGAVRYLQTRADARDLPRDRDRARGDGLQPDRRRAPRGARPEAAGTVVSAAPLLAVDDLRVRFWTSRGIVHAVNGITFDVRAGRDARARRRVRVRQERHRARDDGDPAAAARIPSGSIKLEGRELIGLSERAWRRVRGKEIAMIFQDPMTSLNPVLTVGAQLRESIEEHLDLDRKAATSRADRAARPGRDPERHGPAQELPAPVLRRHATARDDRDGARLRAEAPDRRRADDGARRHDPGADPRSPPRAGAASAARRSSSSRTTSASWRGCASGCR